MNIRDFSKQKYILRSQVCTSNSSLAYANYPIEDI